MATFSVSTLPSTISAGTRARIDLEVIDLVLIAVLGGDQHRLIGDAELLQNDMRGKRAGAGGVVQLDHVVLSWLPRNGENDLYAGNQVPVVKTVSARLLRIAVKLRD